MKEKLKTFEIFSPKIKLPKHGYTKIELKDPYTGRKQVYEDENLITKALEYYLANAGVMNTLNSSALFSSSSAYSSAVEQLLGGVVLFDTAQVENVETVAPLSGSKMTANGAVGITNSGDPLELGSYSATESGWQQDGSYVQTYDFSTTQGNGDIACACLTSRNAGYLGFGNPSGKRITNSNFYDLKSSGSMFNNAFSNVTFYTMFIDTTDSVVYVVPKYNINYNSSHSSEYFANTGKIIIEKRRIPYTKIDIRTSQPNGTYPLVDTIEVTLPPSFMTGITSSIINDSDLHPYVMDGYINLAYCPTYSSPWSASNKLYVCTIDHLGNAETCEISPQESGKYIGQPDDLSDIHWHHYTESNVHHTVMAVSVKDSSSGPTDYSQVQVYDIASGSATYIDNLTYTADFTTNVTSYTNALKHKSWLPIGNSGIYFTHYAKVDMRNATVEPINSYVTSSYYIHNPVDVNPMISVVNYDYSGVQPLGVFRNQNYIASVNNLSTPVTKTADKTMKVSYRITF